MRFFRVRHAVVHKQRCEEKSKHSQNQMCKCYDEPPNNVTLWPLSRSILNGRLDPQNWGLLTSRAFIDAALDCCPSYQDIEDPAQNEQADFSNTQCRFVKGRIPEVIDTVGKPYILQAGDLSFVDFPTDQDKAPGARLVPDKPGSMAVICLDDVFKGLKTIAMSVHNWQAMSSGTDIQILFNRMHMKMDTFRAIEDTVGGLKEFLKDESQCSAITNSSYISGRSHTPEYPKEPQRLYRRLQEKRYHPLRLLTCIFTSVDTIYFVDLTGPAISYSESNKKICNYVDTAINCYCDTCGEKHEGKPKVWAGVEYLRFAELWSCKATELGLELMLTNQREAEDCFEKYWPQEDYHGEKWSRDIPKVRSLVP